MPTILTKCLCWPAWITWRLSHPPKDIKHFLLWANDEVRAWVNNYLEKLSIAIPKSAIKSFCFIRVVSSLFCKSVTKGNERLNRWGGKGDVGGRSVGSITHLWNYHRFSFQNKKTCTPEFNFIHKHCLTSFFISDTPFEKKPKYNPWLQWDDSDEVETEIMILV